MLLLIASFFCIAIGLGLTFFHQQKSQSGASQAIGQKDTFAAEMLSVIQELFPATGFAYDGRTDTVQPPKGYVGDHDYKIFLGNLRNRVQEMGREDRQNYIREVIMAFTDQSEISTEELKANLFLRARTGTELSLRRLLMENPDGKPSAEAIIQRGDVLLELVMDIPNGVRMIDQETLEQHGLNMDDAVNLAATNLLRITPDSGGDLWEKVDAHIWISKPHDDFDAARLFTFPEQMYLPFKGQAVAYTPSHSVVLITDQTDETTLKNMISFGNNAAATHRPLSYDLWQEKDEGWVKMTSTDRASVIYKSSVTSSGRAYAEQKEVLEQIFETKEKDIFVASVMTMENTNTGDYGTLAVFIDGHSYLPIVDYIIPQLGGAGDNGVHIKIKWEHFVDIIGKDKLKAVPGLVPKRLEFSGDLTTNLKTKLTDAGEPV